MTSGSPLTSPFRPSSRLARGRAALVCALVVALLAGCGLLNRGSDDQSVGTATSSSLSASELAAPKGFEKYYTQKISWKKCDSGFVCATFQAPTSWQDASEGSISLAVKVHRATGQSRGALLINPGGPGGSGIQLVEAAPTMFGKDVLSSYDIVGFDPRGVGESTEVKCLGDSEKDRQLSTWYPDDTAGFVAMEKDSKEWADACAKNTGDLLGHVDTQSVARDMDMMRAVFGEAKLDYLGFSYGTQIGSTYAGLFPTHVGRMVLDGAIDPTLSSDETGVQQAVGFEHALRDYVADCETGSSCPLSGGVDAGMAQIKRLLDQTKVRPLPTSDDARPLTATLAFYGVAVTLYSKTSWPYLTAGLTQAMTKGDGTILLNLADQYNDRNSDGSFSTNSAEAFRAVGCLDDPGSTDLATMTKLADQVEQEAPTVGSFFAYGGFACKPWPYPQVKQDFDLAAKGAAPIVVVGTTNDPATPYAWAQGLAKTLDSGVLVTYKGEGHTAYRASNTCIADVVDSYLVDGTVPADGTTCS